MTIWRSISGPTLCKDLYIDPNPIQRGHYYSMNIQVKFDANGNGFLKVWRDGVQIVNYHGSIGTGAATYWKEGIYRSPASETMAVDYRNLHITTGAASAPTTPTTTDYAERRAVGDAGLRFTGDRNRARRQYGHVDARLQRGRDRHGHAYAEAQ